MNKTYTGMIPCHEGWHRIKSNVIKEKEMWTWESGKNESTTSTPFPQIAHFPPPILCFALGRLYYFYERGIIDVSMTQKT